MDRRSGLLVETLDAGEVGDLGRDDAFLCQEARADEFLGVFLADALDRGQLANGLRDLFLERDVGLVLRDVNLPAGQLDGQPRVLALLADGQNARLTAS